MRARLNIACLTVLLVCACAPAPQSDPDQPRRIVSLDFCADQYLLAFGQPDQIMALSPDSQMSFSYLREKARGVPQMRPRAEDILIAMPDAVIRTYGGGPNITRFLERVGIDVIQIDYANDLAAIRSNVIATADALGNGARGRAVVAEMDRRLAETGTAKLENVLYMTSKGAAAGTGTLMDELIVSAGGENFVRRPGWGTAPLERLAYEKPDIIAAGFFDGDDADTDLWSPTRHPVARRAMNNSDVVSIPGAWTACSAWFVVDAVDALAAAP